MDLNLSFEGPACTDAAEIIAGVTSHIHTVMVSYKADGASLSNRQKYPYFFKTIPQFNFDR